jgi:hypothetical protein
MTILSYTATTLRGRCTVVVTSSLSGAIIYHWYVDGCWRCQTTVPTITIPLASGEQLEVLCSDTLDAAWDPVANAPEGHPSRRTIQWTDDPTSGVAYWIVEQKKGAGAWVSIARVNAARRWLYSAVTGRLDDLTTYQWRVTAYDSIGNASVATETAADLVVRMPDPVYLELSYNPIPDTVTVTEDD